MHNKRALFSILILSLLIPIIFASPSFAATCSGVDTSLIECEGGGDAGIWHIILLIIDILTIGIGITAVIGIMIFGIQYLTAGGDVSKTTKAKRRMFEIVIGIIAWVLLYSLTQWLLPGGKFSSPIGDVKKISIEANETTAYTGTSIKPTITIEPEGAKDKTYSLISEDSSVATVVGNTIRCKSEGKATITAVASNGVASKKLTITCQKPPEPETTKKDPANPGSGTGPQPQDTWFKCDNCPSDGSVISQAKSESFNKAYSSDESSITYNNAKQLAKNKGISDDNFYSIVGWARTENYENLGYGNYFAYLCVSTMVNKALNGENLVSQMKNWANYVDQYGNHPVWFYAYAKFLGSNNSSHCQRDEIYGTGETVCGYYDSNVKIAYMALKYTYPNVNSCSGDIPSNILAHQGSIYVGW